MRVCDYCARDLPDSEFASGKRCKSCRYLAQYKVNYREYMEMFKRQSGQCAICRHEPSGIFPDILCIDHDHQWANRIVVRGLVCHACNRGLGCFADNPVVLARAMQYLERREEHYHSGVSHTRFHIPSSPNWHQIIDEPAAPPPRQQEPAAPPPRQQELTDRFGAHLFQPQTLGLMTMISSVFMMWEARKAPDDEWLQHLCSLLQESL